MTTGMSELHVLRVRCSVHTALVHAAHHPKSVVYEEDPLDLGLGLWGIHK